MTEDEKWRRSRGRLGAAIDRMCATPREHLISVLATVCDDGAHARALVDALDEYLADGPSAQPITYQSKSVDELTAERDAAMERAEKAELELRKRSKRKGRRSS